jgi:DNA (cytosine-5)-methyltransferase 1
MSSKQTPEPGPVVLDLFAGAGGFSLGFHWAGFRTRVAIDHNPLAVETLDANFGQRGQIGLVRDLATFAPRDLRRFLRDSGQPDNFDVVVAGPPCQGWSQVGRGKLRTLREADGRTTEAAADPRNELYKHFLAFVADFMPAVAVMENVPGMLSHNRSNVADNVQASMAACGYSVSRALINAADYGVPQTRERLFFVGVRKDLGLEFAFPPAETPNGRRLYPKVTVWDAIGDLPPIPNGSREWRLEYNHARKRSPYAARMRKLADSATVFDHVCRTQNKQDLEAFRFMRQGGWYRDLPDRLKRYRDDIFEDKYKKLYQHRAAWCVTAHLSKDCYTHIHPTQARTISVREAARLQSFPDCFYFAGNMGDKFSLIGNAVAPVVAECIARAIRTQVFDRRASTIPQFATDRELVPVAAGL